MLTEW